MKEFIESLRHKLFLDRVENVDTLIFGGGGIKCMAMVTALFSLCEENIHSWFLFLSKIKTIRATSAGCLVGLLCALSVNYEEIDELVEKVDIANTLFPTFNSEWFVRMVWGHELGLLDSKNLESFYEKVLVLLGNSPNITFMELYAKTKVDLEFYACSVIKCTPVSFSYKTHPNLTVAKAMAASSCIPFLFTMVEINKERYIDGGVMCNVPVQGTEDPNKVLIFSNQYKPETSVHSAIGFGSNLLYMMFESQMSILKKYQLQVVNVYADSIAFLEMFTTQQSFQKTIWNQAKVAGKQAASTFDGLFFLLILFLLRRKQHLLL